MGLQPARRLTVPPGRPANPPLPGAAGVPAIGREGRWRDGAGRGGSAPQTRPPNPAPQSQQFAEKN